MRRSRQKVFSTSSAGGGFHRHDGRGQSLAEYALILSLVAVFSLATLAMLGNNMGSLMSMLGNLLTGNQVASVPGNTPSVPAAAEQNPPSAPPSAAGANPSPALPPNSPSPGTSSATTCFAGSSWCIDMTGGLGPNPVTVTGANGMTQQVYAMANILDQISAEATEDPSTDPVLAQMITDLANRAHAIGNRDASLFELPTSTGVYYMEAGGFMRVKGAVESYLAAHPDALVPGIQQALDYATGNVTAHMTALLGREPDATYDDTGPTNNMVTSLGVQNAINAYTAAQTHAQANQICQNGGQPPACIVPPE